MLESLSIKNFKQHKELRLTFHPKLTAITGPSASGKSATIKALKWCLLNKPTGDSVFPKGAKKKPMAEVEIAIDGKLINRMKSTSVNSYLFNDEIELKSFKNDVPEIVKKFLNLSDHNIQGQFEKHFLLDSTPGERVAKLNDVANLSIIDETRQKVDRHLASIAQHNKYLEGEIARAVERIEALRVYEDPYKEACILFDEFETLEKTADRLTYLQKQIAVIHHFEKEIAVQKKILQLSKPMEDLLSSFSQYNERQQFFETVESLVATLRSYKDPEPKMAAINKVLPMINSWLQSYEDKYLPLAKDIAYLQSQIDLFNKASRELTDKKNTVNTILQQQQQIKKELNVCPICQTPF